MNTRRWLFMFVLISAFMLVSAQDTVYREYTSEDGRISFDVPEGWLVAPFGSVLFNLSTQGYVDAADVQPGQQQIDILTLNSADLAAGGVDPELPLEDFTIAVVDALDEEDTIPDDFEFRSLTLDSGVEAGVIEVALGGAHIFVTVYQQDDVTLLVSSFSHESEFEAFEPIALHVINSIVLDTSVAMSTDMSTIPVVNFVATDDGLELPPVPEEGVPAGFYTFQFINQRSEGEYSPLIARLNEGVTFDDFNEAASTGDGFGAVFLVTLYGGSAAEPGESFNFTTELIPGNYLLLEIGSDGVGDSIPFTVIENEDVEEVAEPQADVTIIMVDFGFGLPPMIASGEQTWKFENAGEQWHEASIVTVPEGTTVADVIARSENPETIDSEFESESVFFLAPMSAGSTSWVTLDLEPGTYAILCYLPDLNGDFTPHLMRGMVSVFTVE